MRHINGVLKLDAASKIEYRPPMKFGFLLIALLSTAACGGSSKTGSCASICAKGVARMCPNPGPNQADCETSCNSQKTKCDAASMSSQYQAYLDCIESNDMTCGETTMSPTSPDCVSEGLAIFSCAL